MVLSTKYCCKAFKVERFFEIISRPEVSLSMRCTNSKYFLPVTSRIASITPKSRPLPPCTAIPDGLLSTIKPSSSNTTRANKLLANSVLIIGLSRVANCTGAMRTTSSRCTRSCALQRLLLTRISSERIIL